MFSSFAKEYNFSSANFFILSISSGLIPVIKSGYASSDQRTVIYLLSTSPTAWDEPSDKELKVRAFTNPSRKL